MTEDERWMLQALAEAETAYREGEVPVGAVVVSEGRLIGRGHNQMEGLQDPTAHAEILAIGAAATHLKSRRLTEASLYVTIEPCPMCAGALVWARIKRLVYGARDPKAGACGSLFNIVQDRRLNHNLELTDGILADQASELLKSFFRQLRLKGDGQGAET
ncbi:tRNA adenosine(34) deaminase TadA [bacterium]|nr:tRNA adenosine(34) deaminase TadA [bacterium]